MNKKSIILSAVFTVIYSLYYFLIVFMFFKELSGNLLALMNFNYFFNQVIILMFLFYYIAKRFLTKQRLIKIGSVLFLVLTSIFILAAIDIWAFQLISGILMFLGLPTSGVIVLTICEINDNRKKRLDL